MESGGRSLGFGDASMQRVDPISTLVIDLDGTLLDVRRRLTACYRDVCLGLGLEPLPADEYWALKREACDSRQLLARSGDASGEFYDRFLQAWLQKVEGEAYLAMDTLQPAAAERLALWTAGGCTLVLATMRQSRSRVLRQLGGLGVLCFFRGIVISSYRDGALGKARQVAEVVDNPRSCLWVGDTESDVDAARHFGCRSWAVASGLRTRDYLAALRPDFLSEHIGDVF